MIPADSADARTGRWENGPGLDLFRAIEKEIPGLTIIAEDLGYITESVRRLVRDTGYPNMKVLEFAFDSRDSSGRESYLPYNYDKNCVVYTGTHDNETIVGWYDCIKDEERKMVREYLCDQYTPDRELYHSMISLAQMCAADTCIIPIQDYLGLDNEHRMNQPSTVGKNWRWRVKKEQITKELGKEILAVTKRYGRTNWDALSLFEKEEAEAEKE